jgi:cysteine dioxygenase
MPGIANNEDQFQLLVKALSDKLGPSSGINSNDVDERELQQLMEEYISDESEWSKYNLSNPKEAYTRNLVDKGNGKSNLVSVISHVNFARLTT